MSCEKQCAGCPVIQKLNGEIHEQERVKGFFPFNPTLEALKKQKRNVLEGCDTIMADAAAIVRKNRLVECQSTASREGIVFDASAAH